MSSVIAAWAAIAATADAVARIGEIAARVWGRREARGPTVSAEAGSAGACGAGSPGRVPADAGAGVPR